MSSLDSERIAGLGFEQVVRDAPVAISVVDASGRIIYSNGRARDLTRRQLGREMPADLDSAIDIFHADGRRYERREWPAIRSITRGEEIVDEAFFYALPEGGRLWISCSSSPVRDEDGRIVAAVVAMTDATEQKRQEQRQLHLRGLLDNMEDAIVCVDAEWFVTIWSAGAERLYGWTAGEVLGRHTLEVARLEMTHEQRTDLRVAVAEHGRWRGELIAYRKDGTSVWVEVINVALRDPRGEITGYLGIHRDVSDRRRADEALREAREQQAALDRRLEDVREAERSRIARDLHDGALQGLTHALAVTGKLASGRDDDVQAILQQVGRQVRAAIYDLRLEHDVERPFVESLHELVALNHELAPGCEVALESADDLPRGAFGRRATEVLRILGEALTNACRHAAAERVLVRVTGTATQLCVEVIDDGHGFDTARASSALHGQGLRGMRERAELINARLDIRSDRTGTTVRLLVALTPAAG
jgi:PAS domain S-box-containing protein